MYDLFVFTEPLSFYIYLISTALSWKIGLSVWDYCIKSCILSNYTAVVGCNLKLYSLKLMTFIYSKCSLMLSMRWVSVASLTLTCSIDAEQCDTVKYQQIGVWLSVLQAWHLNQLRPYRSFGTAATAISLVFTSLVFTSSPLPDLRHASVYQYANNTLDKQYLFTYATLWKNFVL